jgi:hypothetical protein
MTAAMQHEAEVLPSAHDQPPVSNHSTQSAISFAFVGTSLVFAFLYIGGVGVISDYSQCAFCAHC